MAGVANLPLRLPILVPMLAAIAAGAFWGAIAGVLKVKAGTNEVISTLLLSFIAIWMVYWSVQSEALLRQPMTTSATLPESLEIPESTQLPLLTGDYSFPAAHRAADRDRDRDRRRDRAGQDDLRRQAARRRAQPGCGAAGRHFLRTHRHRGAGPRRRARRPRRAL